MTKNTYTVKVGDIVSMKGDVVLNWATSSLNSGPTSFYKIHNTAGPQLRDLTIPFKDVVKPGDAFTTIGCWLPYYAILHSIIPDKPEEWNLMARNIISTLKAYQLNQTARNLYIPLSDLYKIFYNIPDLLYFINLFMTYEKNIENIDFVFVCEFKWEADLISNELKKFEPKLSAKQKIFSFIDNVLKKIVKKISPKSSTALFSLKSKDSGNNKEEL